MGSKVKVTRLKMGYLEFKMGCSVFVNNVMWHHGVMSRHDVITLHYCLAKAVYSLARIRSAHSL